jgi:hypothetical protein
MLYIQDYDETMPGCFWITGPPSSFPNDKMAWPQLVQPYIKNWPIFRCPTNAKDPFTVWNGSTGNIKWYYNWMRWPSYAMNWNYLNQSQGCNPWLPGGNPVTLAAIGQPAATVMLTDVKNVGMDSAGWYVAAMVDSPAALGASDCCTYSNGGWGSGSYGDDPQFVPTPTYTGQFDARHTGGGNVDWTDGHSKWMTPGALAAGTNWHVGIANTDVIITDRSQYLWDLR